MNNYIHNKSVFASYGTKYYHRYYRHGYMSIVSMVMFCKVTVMDEP